MPQQESLINWSDYKVLHKMGKTPSEIANLLGTSLRTLKRQLAKYNIDPEDLSDVEQEAYDRWQGVAGADAPPEPPIDGTDLSWSDIADYLGIGLTIKETAAAAGLTPVALNELYERNHPAIYDCLEVWATVLRARKNYELFKAIEKRALNGDLRAAVVLGKMRHQRWPRDQVEPPNHMHEI